MHLSMGMAGAFVLFLLFGGRFAGRIAHNLDLTFLDVGQGDSTLIEFPDGRVWVVDAGGGFREWDIGRAEIFPELARRGRLTLDSAVLTHPDQDHAYGFRGLFEEITVENFLLARASLDTDKPLLGELRSEARRRSISERLVSQPFRQRFGGAEVELLPTRVGSKTNNNALLVLVSYAGCRALITGDIEAVAEDLVVASGAPAVDLLKVAHHGSRTSSTDKFLRRFKPRWGVISVGRHNRYGHPHAEVVERLRRRNINLLRTDFHGYVRYTISPTGDVSCRTSRGPCGTARCQAP